MDKQDYALSARITRLANRGVRKSIEMAKKLGIANPFVLDGKLMYKMPDGSIKSRGCKAAAKSASAKKKIRNMFCV